MYVQNVANFVDYSRLILGRFFCKCPWPGEGGRERELLPLHVRSLCAYQNAKKKQKISLKGLVMKKGKRGIYDLLWSTDASS